MQYKVNGTIINSEVPLVVCISGSMKFYNRMIELAKELTLHNYIVLMPFISPLDLENKSFVEQGIIKANLDLLHLAKIDLCDVLLVVDQDDIRYQPYIGDSTHFEISYAYNSNKRIVYQSVGGLE